MGSNIVFFHTYSAIVRHTCRPPTKRWNQSRNNAFFLGFLLLTLVLIAVPVAVVITTYKATCGMYAPAVYETPYSAVGLWIAEQGVVVRGFARWVSTPAFVLPVFGILGVAVYYLTIIVRKLKMEVNDLKHNLQQERLDKNFFLKHLASAPAFAD